VQLEVPIVFRIASESILRKSRSWWVPGTDSTYLGVIKGPISKIDDGVQTCGMLLVPFGSILGVKARVDHYQSLHVTRKKGDVTTLFSLSKPGSIRELITSGKRFFIPVRARRQT